jgi:hypothetical protein
MRKLCRGIKVFAVPNAGKRTQWAAAKAKREGHAQGLARHGRMLDVTNDRQAVSRGLNSKTGKDDARGQDQIETLNWLHRRGPSRCGVPDRARGAGVA